MAPDLSPIVALNAIVNKSKGGTVEDIGNDKVSLDTLDIRPTLHKIATTENELSRCGRITLVVVGSLVVFSLTMSLLHCFISCWKAQREEQWEEEESLGHEMYRCGSLALAPAQYMDKREALANHIYQKLEPVLEEEEVMEEESKNPGLYRS